MNALFFGLFSCNGVGVEPVDTSETPVVCDARPVETGQIQLIDPNLYERGCPSARIPFESLDGGTQVFIDKLEDWANFRQWCGGPNYQDLLPEINFETHEVIGSGFDEPCPKGEPIVASPTTCEDGVLSVELTVNYNWCLCETNRSVMALYVVPKGLIRSVYMEMSVAQECSQVECECQDGVRSGCLGCAGY